MAPHKKIKLTQGKRMLLLDEKYHLGHSIIFPDHDCGPEVTNLMGGMLVWTRIRFDCGCEQKVNAALLQDIGEIYDPDFHN